jgi:hypothetical protein
MANDGGLELIEFRVVDGHENEDGDTEDNKGPEGNVSENPERGAGEHAGIGIKKTEAAGDKEYQSHYQKENKHTFFPEL